MMIKSRKKDVSDEGAGPARTHLSDERLAEINRRRKTPLEDMVPLEEMQAMLEERLATEAATESDVDEAEKAAFLARRAERERRRAAEDAEAQAWYDSRPDVEEAVRGSQDKSTRVQRGRPRRRDTSEAVEEQP